MKGVVAAGEKKLSLSTPTPRLLERTITRPTSKDFAPCCSLPSSGCQTVLLLLFSLRDLLVCEPLRGSSGSVMREQKQSSACSLGSIKTFRQSICRIKENWRDEKMMISKERRSQLLPEFDILSICTAGTQSIHPTTLTQEHPYQTINYGWQQAGQVVWPRRIRCCSLPFVCSDNHLDVFSSSFPVILLIRLEV